MSGGYGGYGSYGAAGSGSYIGYRYGITASIMYNGLTATDTKYIEIDPPGGLHSQKYKFLMSFPQFKNAVWADGEDYLRLTITNNSNLPGPDSYYSSCFQECVPYLFAMNNGQNVDIYCDPSIQILYGDVQESTDPYTGENDLIIGSNAVSSYGTANIPVSSSGETFVYFRINAFFPPVASSGYSSSLSANLTSLSNGGYLNPCQCLHIIDNPPLIPTQPTEYTIKGQTLINVNGINEIASGGGSMTSGVPPTI